MTDGVEEAEDGDDLPDEQESPSRAATEGEPDDGFDDLPATHLADEEYEEFVASEFDAQGREKGDPPVVAILLGITALILLAWLLWAR